MNTLSSKRIEEYRESGHKCLTLSCSHLGDLSLMENDTTDKLHIVVYHIPSHLVSTRNPMVLPEGIVTVDGHEFLCCAEVTVKVSCLYLYDWILLETACCRLHDGKCIRKDLVKHLLNCLIHLLHKLV